jgi:WD40 repeat protein
VVAFDLRTGAAIGTASAQMGAQQFSLTTAVLDGTPVAVTGGVDNVLRTWNLLTGQQIGRPLAGHTQGVTVLRTVQVGDRVVLVSSTGGSSRPAEAETAFWDLADGTPLGPPLIGHPSALTWLTATVDGRAALITRTLDGIFTVWNAAELAGTE